jgi:hypothetical protein
METTRDRRRKDAQGQCLPPGPEVCGLPLGLLGFCDRYLLLR